MSLVDIYSTLGQPVMWVLEQLASALGTLPPLAAAGSFGLAIIVVTLVIRTVLFPVFSWQLRIQQKIQSEQRKVAPQLAELRKKYKGQPQKLNEEMQKLYREHDISPFSSLTGCLPALVQMPVVVALYQGIRLATDRGNLDHHFLWIGDVTQSASKVGQLATHWPLLILPLVAAAATYVQSKMMMPPLRPDMTEQEKSMQGVSRSMSMILPAFIFWLGLNFPQGVALYWVTQSLYMVCQQYYAIGWGSMPVPSWVPGAQRTTALGRSRFGPAPAPVAAVSNGSGPKRKKGSTPSTPKEATTATRSASAPRPPRPANARTARGRKRRR